MLFIWIGTAAAILSFSVGKWIPISGAIARFVLLGFFSLSVVIYAIKNGMNDVTASHFIPSGLSTCRSASSAWPRSSCSTTWASNCPTLLATR